MANIEDRIKSQLARGQISLAKESLKEKYLKEDKADWYRAMQEEYDALYYEDIEYIEVVQDDDGNDVEVTKTKTELKLTAPTFHNWLNETRVVTEAVEEVSHTELIDGVETKVIDTEAVAEVTELVRPYTPLDVTDRVDAYINGKYKELRAKEYPPIADYVDAVVKDDTEAIEAYKEACLAVKAKYPKL